MLEKSVAMSQSRFLAIFVECPLGPSRTRLRACTKFWRRRLARFSHSVDVRSCSCIVRHSPALIRTQVLSGLEDYEVLAGNEGERLHVHAPI